MKMQPVLVERIWGGRRLADILGKTLPPDTRIGESWELADHPNGRSRVADGPLAGQTLREVLERHGPEILGRASPARAWAARFGLLIKFIDATDRLSVQVHPDDAYASAHVPGESGKTECWVVVHAEPGAWLINGLKPGTTRDRFADALKKGRIEELLVQRPVKAGDFVWVPAGTVHAIGPGIVLAEVQQNSDLTYRVYDWGRVGLDGKPRPIQVAEALESIRFAGDPARPPATGRPVAVPGGDAAASPAPAGGRGKTSDETGLVIDHLVDSAAFSLSRIILDRRPWAADTRGSCAVLVVLAGKARLATGDGQTPIRAGDTILVPADAKEYALEQPERLTVLVAAPPGKAPLR
jgi:mannose-6-phosphate isomerase